VNYGINLLGSIDVLVEEVVVCKIEAYIGEAKNERESNKITKLIFISF
jgi:hypothetical protein